MPTKPPKNWQEVKFKKFLTLQRGFDLPKYKFKYGNYPVLGSTGIIGYHNKYKQKGPGVVTGRSGSLGAVLYTDKSYWPHNTSLWVKDFKNNIPKFVYYFLKTFPLEKFNSGAGVPTLNRNHLDEYKIKIPSVKTQKKIAFILSIFDELIENNRRRIKILEEMAQLLYREWFVEFRFLGHQKVKMVDSELGKIPEGWKICSYSQVASYLNGFAFKPEHWGKQGIPIIKIAELKNGISDSTPYYIGNEVPEKYIINSEDILFSWSGDLDVYFWPHEEGYLNQHLFKVTPLGGMTKAYLYHSLKFNIEEFRIRTTGATMHHIKKGELDKVKITIPLSKILEDYEVLIKPVLNEILNLTRSNKNLTNSRDILLSKLMSGEIKV